MGKIPVILDTDIGGDIDDTWALAMLLKSPELDVKLVVSDTDDTVYRSRLIAKFLEVAGRTDIPVGVGIRRREGERFAQSDWIEDYNLADYPGKMHIDGVQAIIDTIMNSPEPIKLICIGPVPNIIEALKREPRIVENADFVGMHGSFRYHHKSNRFFSVEEGQIPEWNVVCDIPAAQAVFRAKWRSITITPLDTCARIVFDGADYQDLLKSSDPVQKAVIENYRIWATGCKDSDATKHSSVLYDTVAVYLAFTTDRIKMERVPVIVDDKGYTQIDAKGQEMAVAMEWLDLPGYMKFLKERLLAPVVRA